jgi:hypothetical protein
MRAAADDTVFLLPGLRAAIPALIVWDATILKERDLES